MFRGVTDILQTLGQLLPPWAMGVVVVLLLIVVAPAWLDNMRSKQIRGRIRRMVRASDAEREQLAQQVLALAGRKPRRLVVLVQQAIKREQTALRDRGLQLLEETGKAPKDVAWLKKQLVKESKAFGHPVEAASIVERLIASQMWVAARERLDEAQARFPDDPELSALRERIPPP